LERRRTAKKGSKVNEAQKLAQKAAELLWSCATSNDLEIASYASPIYQSAEKCFIDLVALAYRLTDEQARTVRDIFAEYGPDDSLTDTTGRGVESYVQRMHLDKLEEDVDRMTYLRNWL
jgi:hypothetical protein